MNNIPAIGQPFEVSFKNYKDYKFKAKVVSIDPKETYGIRVQIFHTAKKYVNHIELKDVNEFCDVERDWFNTQLTGRIITPIL